jgi:hypothetical protein
MPAVYTVPKLPAGLRLLCCFTAVAREYGYPVGLQHFDAPVLHPFLQVGMRSPLALLYVC